MVVKIAIWRERGREKEMDKRRTPGWKGGGWRGGCVQASGTRGGGAAEAAEQRTCGRKAREDFEDFVVVFVLQGELHLDLDDVANCDIVFFEHLERNVDRGVAGRRRREIDAWAKDVRGSESNWGG